MSDSERYDATLALDPARAGLAELMSALADESWRVRKVAAQVAARFVDDAKLIPALVSALASDDNAGLRNAASEALVRIGASSVLELATQLATGDADQRKFIVEVLGAIGSPEAQAALFAAQDDNDVNVRAAVAESLGRIGGNVIVARLIERLKVSTDLQQIVYVLDALARASARVPFEQLTRFTTNPSVARSLYPVLGHSADMSALTPLLTAIASAPEGSRNVAIIAVVTLLDSTGDASAVIKALTPRLREKLTSALDAESDAVVAGAIRLLALTGDAELAPRLLAAAACRTVVETAMDATLDFGRAATKPLLREVDRVGIEARVLFLEALECLADPSAIPDLLELARGAEDRTTEAALRALGAFGDEAVIPPLLELAIEGDVEAARQAMFALVTLSLRFPDAVLAAVSEAMADGSLRPVCLQLLGAVGRDEDIALVDNAVRHSDPDVRTGALDAAASFGQRFPHDTLVFALADERAAVRAAAARALGEHHRPETVLPLIAATRDRSSTVALAALRALGTAGDERAIPVLTAALESDEAPNAIAALQSLFVLRPDNLEDAVRSGLAHRDPEVVREAIDVTLRLPASAARALLVPALAHTSWNVRRAAAESLTNRALDVPKSVVANALRNETEPLVRDELERLSHMGSHS